MFPKKTALLWIFNRQRLVPTHSQESAPWRQRARAPLCVCDAGNPTEAAEQGSSGLTTLDRASPRMALGACLWFDCRAFESWRNKLVVLLLRSGRVGGRERPAGCVRWEDPCAPIWGFLRVPLPAPSTGGPWGPGTGGRGDPVSFLRGVRLLDHHGEAHPGGAETPHHSAPGREAFLSNYRVV